MSGWDSNRPLQNKVDAGRLLGMNLGLAVRPQPTSRPPEPVAPKSARGLAKDRGPSGDERGRHSTQTCTTPRWRGHACVPHLPSVHHLR